MAEVAVQVSAAPLTCASTGTMPAGVPRRSTAPARPARVASPATVVGIRAALEVTAGDQPVDQHGRRGRAYAEPARQFAHPEGAGAGRDVVQRQQVGDADAHLRCQLGVHRGRGLQQSAQLLTDLRAELR